MPVVMMPDGVAVDMPDQIDPSLGARLRAFHDTTPHEATSGPSGFLNGVAEIAGKGIGNIPMGIVHGARDLASRIGGHGPHPSEPTFPLSPNAQTVAQSIGGELSNAAEPYRVPAIEPALEKAAPILSDVAQIAPIAGPISGIARGLSAAPEIAATAPAAVRNLGLRTAESSPIARNVAGHSGREALTEQNQSIVDPTAGAVAGVPHGAPLNSTTLEAGREAPNSVYSRAAEHIPTGPLSPTAAQVVQGIGSDDLVVHSPDTQATIEAQKQRLLSGPMTGPQVVDAQKALRFNGFRNASSEDPEQLAVGHAQLKMADALHQHMADTLSATAPVSAEQLTQARQALAQNHTVENVLKGGNVDLQALARVHRNNPNMLSGPLKDLAEFGDLHPEVSSLPGAGARYNPAGVAQDIAGFDIVHPVGAVARMFGGNMARRSLLGSPEAAAAARTATPVRGMGDEFAPLDRGTPQPPPGLTAGPMGAPPSAGQQGGIPLADLLSHGVEQSPPLGLSLAPEAAPQGGIPFNVNAEHAAGGLSLADELSPFRGKPMDMSDFAGVKSQGVPEGIVQRSPSNRFTADTVDFPGGTERKRIVENDSGGGPASLEAQSRLKGEKAAGTRPVMIGPEGDETPILHDVSAVDRSPSKGGIILDAKTGKIINSGNMKPAAAQALVNRWKARRSLGDEF